MRRYQELAFRAAYLITGNASDAEDVTQNAFLKAWRALDRFDAGVRRAAPVEDASNLAAFRPWLLTIVANEARNARRSRSRRPETDLAPLALELIDSDTSAPEAIAVAREEQEELVRSINHLSPEDRLVIQLRYVLGLSEAEMADALDVPRGTVKSRLSRALRRAREQLAANDGSREQQERRHG